MNMIEKPASPVLPPAGKARPTATSMTTPAAKSATIRHDGWTLCKQQIFCTALAESGRVDLAVLQVEMSTQSAYRFRATAKGQEFARAWDIARALARRYMVERAVALAAEGESIEQVVDLEVVVERRRNTPALALKTLERLRSATVLGNATAVAASRDFETCLAMLVLGKPYPAPGTCDGGTDLCQLQASRDAGLDAGGAQTGSLTQRGRSNRNDFTPERQRLFCEVLAATGNVFTAAGYVSIGKPTAYRLRQSKAGRAFAIAWDAALLVASERLVDDAYRLAAKGSVERVYRNKELVAERRVSNALSLLDTFTRLSALDTGNGDASDFDDLEACFTHFTPEQEEI